jgi:hypothetical protein
MPLSLMPLNVLTVRLSLVFACALAPLLSILAFTGKYFVARVYLPTAKHLDYPPNDCVIDWLS